jgi:1,2-dihydroxy-3-keto-5-methylthiopentene dioxygenase
MDEDRKSTALKALQGIIWRDGYLNGDFTGHLYPDVLPALEKWKAQGIDLYVYSSGSVAAQKLLFGYSDEGDITHLFTGYFDTLVGAKREVQSYRNIAEHLGHAPGTILFLSDIHQELDAAEAAGLRTSSWYAATATRRATILRFSVLTTFIRSRSQHERINSFSVTDPQTPVWHSTDAKAIQDQLNAKGVRFERWQADRDLGANPSPETVIAAYQHAIDKLVAEKGYQSWDVISLRADNPQKEALREKFLNEHTHGEDEVRFFVEGAGLFCLHIGDEVFQVLCEKNDLISVPAHTPHWFDMGSEPNFTAIRIFDNPEGWIAQFTGDDIASAYPRLA